MLSTRSSLSQKLIGSRWLSSKVKSSRNVPLFEPFPRVPALEKYDPTVTSKVSQLASGVKVATVSTPAPFVSVGLFVNSGSRHENDGFTFFLQQHGFQSTQSRSSLRVVREAELMGAQYSISAGREHLCYSGEVLPEFVPNLVHHLVDVTQPKLTEYEINETKSRMEEVINGIHANTEEYILDVAHQQAFRNQGLGNSLFTQSFQLDEINPENLSAYHKKKFRAENLTIVAVGGVSHEEFSQLVKQNVPENKSKQIEGPTTRSVYFGGEHRIRNSGDSHIVLGFEGVGYKSSHCVTAGVLQFLIGESVSPNSRPGTGAASILGHLTRSANSPFHKLSSFNFNYSDSGFFGVSSVASGSTSVALDLLLSSLRSLVSSPISSAHLDRAKAQYKFHLANNTQSSLVQFAHQQAQSGSNLLPHQLSQSVDSVSPQAVQSLAKQFLSSNPTLVVVGDVSYVLCRYPSVCIIFVCYHEHRLGFEPWQFLVVA